MSVTVSVSASIRSRCPFESLIATSICAVIEQVPAWQTPTPLQVVPSGTATWETPPPGSQASAVHALPSSTTGGVPSS
jgi:hypothetical protein